MATAASSRPAAATPVAMTTLEPEAPSDVEEPVADDGTGDGEPTPDPSRKRVEVAPELQPLDPPRWIRHHRAPRETLRQVALRHGVSESKLREWNGLAPDDPAPRRKKRLKIWARRKPPPRRRVDYTVQEGDTWWSVALRHGVDGRDLRAYNWPARKKMKPGGQLQIWVDPVVYDWILAGPDPLPPDLDRGWRRGAFSVGTPNEGVLVNGLRIPDTEGVHLRIPRSAYGTSHAVHELLAALEEFRARTDYPTEIDVGLGSMSRPRGGEIGGHLSHQSGRDIDIKLLRRPDVAAWREIRGTRVQWSAVWDLVYALSKRDVMIIFLDQRARRRLFRAAREAGAKPEDIDVARRLVRHSPGHEHHLHVRFGCGPFEPECVP